MGKVCLVLVTYCALFVLNISARLSIPTADLLGPETCPTGSSCVETSQCTSTHYTTKSGHPFYCGPRHSIDSKVCCAETAWNPDDALHPDLDLLESNSSDFDPSGLNKRTTENDDEVDIVSLPFAVNQDEDELPNFILFDSDTDTVPNNEHTDYTESLLEDAIEEELNLGQPLSSQSTVRETGLGDGDEINNDFGKIVDNHLNNGHESFHGGNQFDGTRPIMGENPSMEFRMRQGYEEANRNRAFSCPCEKGERGDPGPKGEPGEPGKIIYIPVFVNAASPGSPTPMPGQGSPPMFSSPQQMNQHVPQHPNPTVMPFNVPVSVQSLPPTQPVGHAASTVSPPQQQQYYSAPSSLSINQLQQPTPVPPTLANPIPYAESLEARLTRNAFELKQNDQRYANRRY